MLTLGTLPQLEEMIDKHGISPAMKEALIRCTHFHTFPSPGLLIGVFMTDYALELLKAEPGETLYGVSESHKCAPDALQVLAHCTIGNNRLRVIPIGRFAITLNRKSWDAETKGVRVYVDLEKLKKYQTLYAWFTNDPSFDHHGDGVMTLLEEIIASGREILSSEEVIVLTEKKKKWISVTCKKCGETVPDYLAAGDLCTSCAGTHYYRKA
jgi:formylmethanofuran dehydrogenase subunit E